MRVVRYCQLVFNSIVIGTLAGVEDCQMEAKRKYLIALCSTRSCRLSRCRFSASAAAGGEKHKWQPPSPRTLSPTASRSHELPERPKPERLPAVLEPSGRCIVVRPHTVHQPLPPIPRPRTPVYSIRESAWSQSASTPVQNPIILSAGVGPNRQGARLERNATRFVTVGH